MKKILIFLIALSVVCSCMTYASKIKDDPEECYICREVLDAKRLLVITCSAHMTHKDCWAKYVTTGSESHRCGMCRDSVEKLTAEKIAFYKSGRLKPEQNGYTIEYAEPDRLQLCMIFMGSVVIFGNALLALFLCLMRLSIISHA